MNKFRTWLAKKIMPVQQLPAMTAFVKKPDKVLFCWRCGAKYTEMVING